MLLSGRRGEQRHAALPRALDRALAGALVGLCRHGLPEMTFWKENGSRRGALDRFSAGLVAEPALTGTLNADEAKLLEQAMLAICPNGCSMNGSRSA